MERILRGIMRYRVLDRASMVKQFQEVRDNPVPKAIFYTCMDSRMIPTRFTETSVGDMFVVRNAGNLIPHSEHFVDEMTSCEPAGLELSCIVNDIRNREEYLHSSHGYVHTARLASINFYKWMVTLRSLCYSQLKHHKENSLPILIQKINFALKINCHRSILCNSYKMLLHTAC
ncbi:beta carbonic anhydrase 1 isoform X2 [Papilio machaon]|uniref:beta carbonic anhydrase 1 isoform X2 n=1 Tax=Papilio machaon TaxID=76193 RepID=UPI0006EB0655|nr:beta carbonic anhydrase 1 isoform X2 [Papilio machaon]